MNTGEREKERKIAETNLLFCIKLNDIIYCVSWHRAPGTSTNRWQINQMIQINLNNLRNGVKWFSFEFAISYIRRFGARMASPLWT